MAKKGVVNPIARIDYEFDYATKDELGNELTTIVGAAIYVLYPGADEYVKQGCVPYPEKVYSFEVNQDGQYAIKHCTRTAAVIHPDTGIRTIAEGAPSPAVCLSIQCARAAASGPGNVEVVAEDQVVHDWLDE